MKAKSNFSQLVEESTAKGSIAIFSGIAAFIGGFVAWSVSCVGGALISLLN